MKMCKKCEKIEVYSSRAHYCLDCKKDVDREKANKYYNKNKEFCNQLTKKYKKEKAEHISEYNKRYQSENRDELNLKRKKYRELNKEDINKYQKNWREKNKEYSNLYHQEYSRRYYKKFPWRKAWRIVLTNSLKRIGQTKENTTIILLGYSPLELKSHLEKLFVDNMSWSNYGEWHIDHINPVSSFEKSTPIHVVNSLENLQPLWKKENLSKGKKTGF